MNIYFSCAISKLFNDVDNIKKLYDILVSLNIGITSIYLNTLDLNSRTSKLLLNLNYFFNTKKMLSLKEVHLKKTNFNINNNQFYILFNTDFYPNIIFIDISENNITKNQISKSIYEIKRYGEYNPTLINYFSGIPENSELQPYTGDLIFHTINQNIENNEVLPNLISSEPILKLNSKSVLPQSTPVLPSSTPVLPQSKHILPQSKPVLPLPKPVLPPPKPVLPPSKPVLSSNNNKNKTKKSSFPFFNLFKKKTKKNISAKN
jgi:hypothetical protein